jgi:predicted transposase YbfD/YdcC
MSEEYDIIDGMKIEEIIEAVKGVEDPRRKGGNLRHRLEDILVIGLCTILSGGEDFVDMEEVGKERYDRFKAFLELPNGIPDSDTFRRVFEKLNPQGLSGSVRDWLVTHKSGRIVNIDGKTIRGSGNDERKAYHVVSAWVGNENLTLGEVAVSEKSNEIPAAREVLELIDIEGGVVTADAMHCQAVTASKIIEKKADYVLAVKDNQSELHENIKLYFEKEESEYATSTSEKGHGRIERREYKLETRIPWLLDKSKWEGLNGIGCVERCVEEKGVVRQERRYFITSLTDMRKFAESVRGHWSIENQLHWRLDVLFGEDNARARKDNSPLNLNILRKIALKLLSDYKPPQKRLSLKKKMLIVAMNHSHLHNVLFQNTSPS